MKNIKIPFLLFLALICCKHTDKQDAPFDLTGRVVGVKDGDTIVLRTDDSTYTIRLAHIDCPEKGQAFGKNAKQFTSDFCFDKTVHVRKAGKNDRNGRIIGEVYLGCDTILNQELVRAGLAWHYKKYSDHATYATLEEEARQKKAGLWIDDNPVPPWIWRKLPNTIHYFDPKYPGN